MTPNKEELNSIKLHLNAEKYVARITRDILGPFLHQLEM